MRRVTAALTAASRSSEPSSPRGEQDKHYLNQRVCLFQYFGSLYQLHQSIRKPMSPDVSNNEFITKPVFFSDPVITVTRYENIKVGSIRSFSAVVQ